VTLSPQQGLLTFSDKESFVQVLLFPREQTHPNFRLPIEETDTQETASMIPHLHNGAIARVLGYLLDIAGVDPRMTRLNPFGLSMAQVNRGPNGL
jgi:hypothetical protein